MGRFKIKKSKDWKAKLRPYRYRDLFEQAVERTAELGLPDVDVEYVDARHFSPGRLKEFGSFVAEEFAPALAGGLAATCIVVHSGLVGAVEEFFKCKAYFTVGSVITPKGEMYPLSAAQVHRWMTEKVDARDVELHAWITLDSMEILDMTFLPTIADVSRRPEIAKPIATHPDLLPRAQPQGPDPAMLPNGLRYSPFVVGQAFLERLGLATVHINY